MIRRAPIGSIYQPSNPGNGSTEDTDLIQCVDGQEPQIHEVRSLGLDGIIHEVNPTAQVEVSARNIREFVTNYLDEMDSESI